METEVISDGSDVASSAIENAVNNVLRLLQFFFITEFPLVVSSGGRLE